MNRGELIGNANAKSNEFSTSSESESERKDTSDEGVKIGSDIEAGTVTAVELEIETVSVIALTVGYHLGPGIQNTTSHLHRMFPLLCYRLLWMRSHSRRLLCKCY